MLALAASVAEAQTDASAAAPDAAACQELPAWGVPVGIAMGTVASIGINIGQNLQADGIRNLPESQRETQPWKSKKWQVGQGVFVSFSIVNFAALALAPASVLVPLESIQFVTNVAYSRIVHKTQVPIRMLAGVFCAVAGTVLSVVFGASGSGCHTLSELEWAWREGVGWWIWCGFSLVTALTCLRINVVYTRKLERGEKPWGHEFVRPITFTLSSALLGGSQMIVQSKVFSELLGMLFQGDYTPWLSWLAYVALVMVVACGILWVVKLTQCLGIYNPLLILPLMVATYILFGGIAGGIYFREFDTLHLGMVGVAGWPLYVGGLLLVLLGLFLIATAGITMEKAAKAKAEAEARQRAAKSGKDLWRKLRVYVKFTSGVKMSGALMPQAEVANHHPVLMMARGASNAVQRRMSSVLGESSMMPRRTVSSNDSAAKLDHVDLDLEKQQAKKEAPRLYPAVHPADNLCNLGSSWMADYDDDGPQATSSS